MSIDTTRGIAGLKGALRYVRAYRDHPFIHVPAVYPQFSTKRVLTTELVAGHTWDQLLTWGQHERDLAAETLFDRLQASHHFVRVTRGLQCSGGIHKSRLIGRDRAPFRRVRRRKEGLARGRNQRCSRCDDFR